MPYLSRSCNKEKFQCLSSGLTFSRIKSHLSAKPLCSEFYKKHNGESNTTKQVSQVQCSDNNGSNVNAPNKNINNLCLRSSLLNSSKHVHLSNNKTSQKSRPTETNTTESSNILSPYQ